MNLRKHLSTSFGSASILLCALLFAATLINRTNAGTLPDEIIFLQLFAVSLYGLPLLAALGLFLAPREQAKQTLHFSFGLNLVALVMLLVYLLVLPHI